MNSEFIINLTVNKLAELESLKTAIRDLMTMAQAPKAIKLSVDATAVDAELDRVERRIKKAGLGGKGGAAGGGTVTVDTTALDASIRSLVASVDKFAASIPRDPEKPPRRPRGRNNTNTGEPASPHIDFTKFETATTAFQTGITSFDSAITKFENAITALANAAADLAKGAAAGGGRAPGKTPTTGAGRRGRAAVAGATESVDADHEAALRMDRAETVKAQKRRQLAEKRARETEAREATRTQQQQQREEDRAKKAEERKRVADEKARLAAEARSKREDERKKRREEREAQAEQKRSERAASGGTTGRGKKLDPDAEKRLTKVGGPTKAGAKAFVKEQTDEAAQLQQQLRRGELHISPRESLAKYSKPQLQAAANRAHEEALAEHSTFFQSTLARVKSGEILPKKFTGFSQFSAAQNEQLVRAHRATVLSRIKSGNISISPREPLSNYTPEQLKAAANVAQGQFIKSRNERFQNLLLQAKAGEISTNGLDLTGFTARQKYRLRRADYQSAERAAYTGLPKESNAAATAARNELTKQIREGSSSIPRDISPNEFGRPGGLTPDQRRAQVRHDEREAYNFEALKRRADTRSRFSIDAAALENSRAFAGFTGRTPAEQRTNLARVLQRNLRGISTRVEQFQGQIETINELKIAGSPEELAAARRQALRTKSAIDARTGATVKYLEAGIQQGIPGTARYRGALQQYTSANQRYQEERAFRKAVAYQRDLQRNAPDEGTRAAAAAKAEEIIQAGKAKGFTRNSFGTTRDELQRARAKLLDLADGFQKSTLATDKHTGALSRFYTKLRELSLYAGGAAVVYGIGQMFSTALRDSIKLEAQLTRIQGILPGLSRVGKLEVESGVFKAAQQYGVNISDAVHTAQLFAQAGLSAKETVQETQQSLAAQVGGGLEAQQAVETALAVRNITAERGTGQPLVSSNDIFSRIAHIEAEYSVVGQDLAVAVQRIGSLTSQLQPQQVGNQDAFDKLIGAVTEIVQTTRVTGNQAATGFRFILSRLTFPAVGRALQSRYGIRLADETGRGARPALDILEDIAKTYQNLKARGEGRKAQELLVQVSGGRQVGLAAALFDNFDRAMKISAESSLTFGDIQRRTSLQLTTLEAKLKQAGNAFTIFIKRLGEESGLFDAMKRLAEFIINRLGNPKSAVGTLGEGIATTGATILGIKFAKQLISAGGLLRGGVSSVAFTGVKTLGGGVLAGTAEGIAAGAGLKAVPWLGKLVGGILNIARLNPVITTIATVGTGIYAYERYKHRNVDVATAQYEQFRQLKPLDRKLLNESAVGQDLTKYSERFGSSPLALVEKTQLAAERTIAALSKGPNAKFKEGVYQLDAEGLPKATDTRLFKAQNKEFLAQMEKLIPGLSEVTDESDRLAIAMRLLNRATQFQSAQTNYQADQIVSTTNDLLTEYRKNITALATGSVLSPESTAGLVKKIGQRGSKVFAEGGANIILNKDLGEQIGLGFNKDIADALAAKSPQLASDSTGAVLGITIRGVLKNVLGPFGESTGALTGFRNQSGQLVDAIGLLVHDIQSNGKTLGAALDDIADNFLNFSKATTPEQVKIIQGNIAELQSQVKVDLKKFILTSRGELDTGANANNSGLVGGQRYFNVLFDAIAKSAKELADEYRKTNPGAAQALRAIAAAGLTSANRGKAFGNIVGRAGTAYARDRLIDLLGNFQIGEERIRGLERGGTGRQTDYREQKLRNVEQLNDGLASIRAQVQLDAIKARAKQNQLDAFIESAATDFTQAAEGDRVGIGDNQDVSIANLTGKAPNPQREALRHEISLYEEAFKALSPDNLKDVLSEASRISGKDRQFLLHGLYDPTTKENLADKVTTFKLLIEASASLEKSRRDETTELQRQIEIQKQLGEMTQRRLATQEQLSSVSREETIRVAALRNDYVGGALARRDQIQARQEAAIARARAQQASEQANYAIQSGTYDDTKKQTEQIRIANQFQTAVEEAYSNATVDMARLLSDERTAMLEQTTNAQRQLADNATRGFTTVFSSFRSLTEGNFLGRLLTPVADAFSNSMAETLNGLLFGKDGVLGQQLQDLFKTPVDLENAKRRAEVEGLILYDRIYRAHIDGLRDGGLGTGTGATGIGTPGAKGEPRITYDNTPGPFDVASPLGGTSEQGGTIEPYQLTYDLGPKPKPKKKREVIKGFDSSGLGMTQADYKLLLESRKRVDNLFSRMRDSAIAHRNPVYDYDPSNPIYADSLNVQKLVHTETAQRAFKLLGVSPKTIKIQSDTGLPNTTLGVSNIYGQWVAMNAHPYVYGANSAAPTPFNLYDRMSPQMTLVHELAHVTRPLDAVARKQWLEVEKRNKYYGIGAIDKGHPYWQTNPEEHFAEAFRAGFMAVEQARNEHDDLAKTTAAAEAEVPGAHIIVDWIQREDARQRNQLGKLSRAARNLGKVVGPTAPRDATGVTGIHYSLADIPIPDQSNEYIPPLRRPGGLFDPFDPARYTLAGGLTNPQHGGPFDPSRYRLSGGTEPAGQITFASVADAAKLDANAAKAARLKALKSALLIEGGQIVGGALGGAVGGKGKYSYASEGASLGSLAGTAIGGPVGGAIGGVLGGLVGGFFGKSKPKELGVLEKIEAHGRAQITAIENMNRDLLTLDNRVLNAPANLVVGGYRPANFGAGNGSPAAPANVQVIVNAQTNADAAQIGAHVEVAVRKALRGEGTYVDSRY